MKPVTQGIVGSLMSSVGFATLDSAGKALIETMDITSMLVLRCVAVMMVIVITLALMGQLGQLATRAPGLTLLRSVLFGLTGVLVILALKHLPLADAIGLYFVSPVWTVLLGAPLLGERITRNALIAALIGLTGAWLLIKPGSGGLDIWSLCALAGGITGAIQDIYARRLRGLTSPAGLLFWGMAAIIPMSLVVLEPDKAGLPQGHEIPLFALNVAAAILAYFFAAQSFQKAPARLIAPLRYLNLLWAVLLGWALWGTVPGPLQTLGMALIVSAGILCIRESRN